jgi:hypothetical protein
VIQSRICAELIARAETTVMFVPGANNRPSDPSREGGPGTKCARFTSDDQLRVQYPPGASGGGGITKRKRRCVRRRVPRGAHFIMAGSEDPAIPVKDHCRDSKITGIARI